MKYTLEKAVIKPIKCIGNTSCVGDYSYKWKQIAMSDDLNALLGIMGDNSRIIDDKTEVISQNFKAYCN